jgi:DNA-binding transcriptional ArsR family regulator
LPKTKFMGKLLLDIDKLELAASKLRAIAHPMRIAIIDLLHEKQLSVTEIYEKLDIEQASASHHLNILKTKGVLASKRNGKKIFYSLKNQTLTEIIECINRCNDN